MNKEAPLAERLKLALRAAELTQSLLAEKLSVSSAAVSQWLTGKKEPSRETLRQVAEVLGVDASWLEYGTGASPKENLDNKRKQYRELTSWVFRPTPEDGGRDFGNANLWTIPWNIETLAKEALQNIIDAAVDTDAGTDVCINLIRLTGKDLDDFLTSLKWSNTEADTGLEEHISASAQNKQKLGGILRDGLESLKREKELLLLRIDDFRTKGLIGSEYGDGNFAALCRNNLDSFKTTEYAGGAYGLGKAVFWRASKFSTVLFSSNLYEPYTADDGTVLEDLRIIGKADLAWHKTKNGEFAGPGWFGTAVLDKDGNPIKAESYWNNKALAHDLHLDRGDSKGTSILVVGFQDASSDEPRSLEDTAAEFEQALSKIFWPALLSRKITAKIVVWDGRTEKSRITVDPNRFHAYFVDAVNKFKRSELSDKLKKEGDVVVKYVPLRIPKRVKDPKQDAVIDEAVLIVRRAPDDYQGEDVNQGAFFRGQEMIITYYSMKMLVSGGVPFHAVVLCGRASGTGDTDTAAEQFLRAAEPPAHDRWMVTPELKSEYAPGSRSNLEAFFRGIRDQIRDLIKPTYENLDDGPRALKELLRVHTAEESPSVNAPRVIIDRRKTQLGPDGSWQVPVRVKLPDSSIWRVVPTLVFAAESGGGRRASWTIKPISGCRIDGDAVISTSGSREIQFVGTSDPASHPAPSKDSAVSVVLQHVQSEVRPS